MSTTTCKNISNVMDGQLNRGETWIVFDHRI